LRSGCRDCEIKAVSNKVAGVLNEVHIYVPRVSDRLAASLVDFIAARAELCRRAR